MAGGKDDERDGDVDGTVSGGDIDSNQVEAARLTAKSQQTRKVKTTYLGHANAIWSMWWPGNRIGWPNNLDAKCKSQGERREVEDYG